MRTDDPRTWMWARALEALSETERLQRQFFHLGRVRTRHPTWEPPVDIYESDGGLQVVVALPGVTADHLDVLSEGRALVIRGDLPVPWEGRIGPIHRMELPHGHFERRIEGLPSGLQVTRNELCDGCLYLTFRKAEGP